MLLVAPTRPQWWVSRRMIRLLTGVALIGALWTGQAELADHEPLTVPVSHSVSVAAVDESAHHWTLDFITPAAFPMAVDRQTVPVQAVTFLLPVGVLLAEALRDRAPPAR